MALRRSSRILMVAALLTALAAIPGEAQRRGRAQRAPQAPPWPSPSVGVHAGYDDASNAWLLGGQIRWPVTRSARFEVMPSGSITFLTGLEDRQFNLDAVYVPGGLRGGLYVAGGLAVRNTIFPGEPRRQTKTGAGLAVGFRSPAGTRVGTQVEFRQIFVDPDLKPRTLTIGVNFALRRGPGFDGPDGGPPSRRR